VRGALVARGGYVVALMLFAVLVYLSVVQDSGLSATGASRMSEAGKTIADSVLWFQFFVAQLVAVVIMSTSINGEARARTLGALKVTHMTNLQIVSGKLMGGMIPVAVLLACSLPVLAIVRVFGGVPWQCVVAGICITAGAATLAGAFAMLLSSLIRQGYLVILAALAVAWGIQGITAAVAMSAVATSPVAAGFIALLTPGGMMRLNSVNLISASISWAGVLWPFHLLVVIGFSSVLVWLCSQLVNQVMLRWMFGEPSQEPVGSWRTRSVDALARLSAVRSQTPTPPERRPPGRAVLATYRRYAATRAPTAQPAPARTRTERLRKGASGIKNSPLLWRESRRPLLPRRSLRSPWMTATVTAFIIAYVVLVLTCAFVEMHAFYLTFYFLLGAATTTVLAATTITSERRDGTWALLLTTPLSDWHIFLAKAVAVVKRAAVFWGLFFGHLLVFTAVGLIHPLAAFHLFILAVWFNVAAIGTGAYLGTRLRTTSQAVIANCSLAIGLWVVLPAVLVLANNIVGAGGPSRPLAGVNAWYQTTNPLVQCWVLTQGAPGALSAARDRGLEYNWPGASGAGSALHATGVALGSMIAFGGAGAILAWRAVKNFRKAIV